jgi:hypothetical protein
LAKRDGKGSASDVSPAFVEVRREKAVATASVQNAAASLELLLPCGAVVRLSERFDAVTLRRVVEALS